MKKIIIVFLFTLIGTVSVSAQSESKLKTEKIVEQYFEKLDLSSEQKVQLSSIIEKNNLLVNQFNKRVTVPTTDTNNEFNRLMKSEISDVYAILTKSQFKSYKKLRETIEPNKKYRLN